MELLQQGTENSTEFVGAVRPVNVMQQVEEVRKHCSEVLMSCLSQAGEVGGRFAINYRKMIEALDTLMEMPAYSKAELRAKISVLDEIGTYFGFDDPYFRDSRMRLSMELAEFRKNGVGGLRSWVMGALGALIFHG